MDDTSMRWSWTSVASLQRQKSQILSKPRMEAAMRCFQSIAEVKSFFRLVWKAVALAVVIQGSEPKPNAKPKQ